MPRINYKVELVLQRRVSYNELLFDVFLNMILTKQGSLSLIYCSSTSEFRLPINDRWSKLVVDHRRKSERL